MLHWTELKLEHIAAVPAQAAQVQPAAVQLLATAFEAQLSGVPEQAPAFQWQPAALAHASAATWLAQVAGCPEHAGVQVQPELSQEVGVAKLEQARGVPLQLVVYTQPAIFPHSVTFAALPHVFGVPLQLSVLMQPLALLHS